MVEQTKYLLKKTTTEIKKKKKNEDDVDDDDEEVKDDDDISSIPSEVLESNAEGEKNDEEARIKL